MIPDEVMTTYLISVRGCDERTEVILELSASEFETVQRLADEVTKWGGGCHPTMAITEATAADIAEVDEVQAERGPAEVDC